MKKLTCIFAVILILALAGCAGVTEGRGTAAPLHHRYPSPNWDMDPTCSPGCPPGMSGTW